MRRLFRILLKVATVLSVLLCAATVTLWVRSYWHRDVVTHRRVSGSGAWAAMQWQTVSSERGWVWASIYTLTWAGPGASERLRQDYRSRSPEWIPGWSTGSQPADPNVLQYRSRDAGWGPVRWRAVLFVGSGRSDELRVAHWLATTLGAAWPITLLAISTRRRARLRRLAEVGSCKQCGYDLRATPERCPECGTMPAR